VTRWDPAPRLSLDRQAADRWREPCEATRRDRDGDICPSPSPPLSPQSSHLRLRRRRHREGGRRRSRSGEEAGRRDGLGLRSSAPLPRRETVAVRGGSDVADWMMTAAAAAAAEWTASGVRRTRSRAVGRSTWSPSRGRGRSAFSPCSGTASSVHTAAEQSTHPRPSSPTYDAGRQTRLPTAACTTFNSIVPTLIHDVGSCFTQTVSNFCLLYDQQTQNSYTKRAW